MALMLIAGRILYVQHVIKDGVWVTMITPFDKQGRIDYAAVKNLIEWYISKGVAGLFAICQSSEMFFLSFKERIELASFVIQHVNGRIGVVISGHVEESFQKQLEELKVLADLKPDALVLVSNRLKDDNDCIIENLKRIEESLPDNISLGMYECPYPDKRLIKYEELKYMINSRRYLFLKDTCCDISIIKSRLEIIKGSTFKLFNANTATLHDSIIMGCNGYCGIMSNFHPELYAWLFNNPRYEKASSLSSIISVMSLIEEHGYPHCAKRYLRNYENINMTDICRTTLKNITPSLDQELDAIHELTNLMHNHINI